MTEAVDTSTQEATPEVATTETTNVESSTEGFSIPSDYADRNYGEKIKSSDDLWKAYDNSQKLIGDRGAFIPKEGASEEDVNSFLEKLEPFNDKLKDRFSPKAPETYEFSELELPEGVQLSDDLTDEFSHMAREIGLTNEQADTLRKDHITSMLKREEARQSEMNEKFEQLGKEMWGGSYEAKVAEATKMLEGKLSKEIADQLWEADPSVLVPVLSLIHEGISERKPDSMPTDTMGSGMSDEQLRNERTRLRKVARQNPTKANLEAFHNIQAKARGK